MIFDISARGRSLAVGVVEQFLAKTRRHNRGIALPRLVCL